MATTVPVVLREDGRLSSIDPGSDYNRYRSQQLGEAVLDYIPPPPSSSPPLKPLAAGNALNRSRRTQKSGGYLSRLPLPSSSDDSSASFCSRHSSRASSSSSVNDLPPSKPVYILTDNPVPRSKPKTTKGFRSKLSKQYTPSDDDSDEEPLGNKVLAFPPPPASPTTPRSLPLPLMSQARPSMFMAGRAVELNSDYGSVSRSDSNFGRGTGTESLRVVSMNAATPSLALNSAADRMEVASQSSKTKKLSLMKRMSKLFSNGSKKAARPASTPPLATTHISGTARIGPSSSTSSRLSLTPSTKGHHKPSMEVLEESPGRQVLQPGSHQGPTSVGYGPSRMTGMLSLPPSALSAHRDRDTRDSGFEDADPSMNTGSINSHNVNRPPVNSVSQPQQGRFSMLMSNVHSRGNRSQSGTTDHTLDPRVGSQRPSMDSDPMWTAEQTHRYQQGQSSQPSRPSFDRPSFSAETMPGPPGNQNEVATPRQSMDQSQHMRQRSATAPVTAVLDQAQLRYRQQGGDISQHPHETQRRSSTPLMYSAAPSQTLVSRIDREKSTVCFQSSPPIDATATKGATATATTTVAATGRQQSNPAVHKGHQQQTAPQISPKITAVVSMPGQEFGEVKLGVTSPRRDSSGSQETNASSAYTNTSATTGVSSVSGVGAGNTSGHNNGNSNSSSIISAAKSKAMASYSPGLALQQQVNLAVDTKKSEPRRFSAGITSKIQSLTKQSKTQQEQIAQQSSQQQPQQQQQSPQPATSRQRPSPKRQSAPGYFTMPSPALQLQQHNQQLKQLQIQTTSPMNTPPLNSPPAPMAAMNASFLNPSSSILSSGGLGGSSPLLDPSWALQRQQQQLQQQIELQLQQQYQQNQHMQLQLQLDQLQHLQLQQHQILMQQQQIDKTRAALMASTSAIVTQQQQQQQQQQLFMMPNFMYPTASASTEHQAR